MAQTVKNMPAMQETQKTRVRSLGQENSPEEEIATHSNILPGNSHGQRCLAGYSSRGRKELETTKLTNHLMYQVLKRHCDEWNDGNHGGSQAAELTCQRVGRLQSLSNDAWARTDSALALSFQTGPDSRRLALGPASHHSIGHWAGLVRCHLPPCSITCCITALLSQAMLQPAVPTKDPRHNRKLPADSRHPHPSQATWACVSVYQTKLFLKSYSSHSSLCFTQPFCLNFLEVEVLIKGVFEVLIEISKLFLPNHQ